MNGANPALIVYPEVVAFGGEERVVLALAGYLHAKGIPYRVACYRDHVGLARHVDFPLPIEEIAADVSGLRARSRALERRLDAHRGSARRPLLFGWQLASHVGALGRSDYFIRIADTPSLMTPPSGLVSRLKSAFLNRLAGRGLRCARRCIANANYIGAEITRDHGAPTSTIYVPGKAPPTRFRRQPGSPPRMLSVSRLEANKRVDWLIEAVARLAPRRAARGEAPVHLDIVGDGPQMATLQAQASLAGAGGLVTFHGFVDEASLEKLYARASLFAMPAWQGFGLPALEALYRDLPVVQHRQSGVSEILHDTPWVELFDGDAVALADAIERMLARLASGPLLAPRPWLPTADSFGDQIVEICRW